MATSLQPAPNDLDTVTSSGVLQVDINEVSAEQLRDIFELSEELAHRIVDYRADAQRIFDLQDLSRIQGLDEPTLKRLTEQPDASAPDVDLQKSLGLAEDRQVPLQEMLEAAIRDARLEGLAVVTPLGLWVAGFLPPELAAEEFLEQIPMTLKELGSDLSKLKLAETRTFSLSTEEYDILIQRAGIFFLVAVQPPDFFDRETHEKIDRIRREIVRRYRPRFHFFHHAEKTPEDILFDCPKCDLRIVIHKSAAGYEVDCPRCEARLIVPDRSLVAD